MGNRSSSANPLERRGTGSKTLKPPKTLRPPRPPQPSSYNDLEFQDEPQASLDVPSVHGEPMAYQGHSYVYYVIL